MAIDDFRDLEVWQRSVDLAVEVYRVTSAFPSEHRFEITSQLRRAAVSVSSNIAEGSGRATTKDLLGFLTTARSSMRETESQLYVCERIGLLTTHDLRPLIHLLHRIGQMLTALRQKLEKRR